MWTIVCFFSSKICTGDRKANHSIYLDQLILTVWHVWSNKEYYVKMFCDLSFCELFCQEKRYFRLFYSSDYYLTRKNMAYKKEYSRSVLQIFQVSMRLSALKWCAFNKQQRSTSAHARERFDSAQRRENQ